MDTTMKVIVRYASLDQCIYFCLQFQMNVQTVNIIILCCLCCIVKNQITYMKTDITTTSCMVEDSLDKNDDPSSYSSRVARPVLLKDHQMSNIRHFIIPLRCANVRVCFLFRQTPSKQKTHLYKKAVV